MNKRIIRTLASFLLLVGSVSATAWAMEGPQGRGGRKGPPPEAIEACKDKSEGAEVQFTNRRGETVKATCRQIDGSLVAVPEGGFRGRRSLPPGGLPGGQ